MRDILFRGKRKDNGEWVFGDLIQCGITGKQYIFPVGNDANESDRVGEDGCLKLVTFEVIPETVGQYTGLADENGRKIFEGDIITWAEDYDDKFGYPATAYGKGIIVWNEENCCFGVKTSDTNIQDFNDFDFDESCVIMGNIHDNTELLKV